MTLEKLIEIILGLSAIGIAISFIILLAYIILAIIGLSKLFQKAGKPKWAAIVPFYNIYVLIEVAELNWWYFLIAISGTICSTAGITGLSKLTTLAGLAARFFIFYNLGKKFKQNPITFGILGIFFGEILVMILGLSDKMIYDKKVKVSPNGPIEDKKEDNQKSSSSEPERFCLGCGKKLKPGIKFCENCGKKVEE